MAQLAAPPVEDLAEPPGGDCSGRVMVPTTTHNSPTRMISWELHHPAGHHRRGGHPHRASIRNRMASSCCGLVVWTKRRLVPAALQTDVNFGWPVSALQPGRRLHHRC